MEKVRPITILLVEDEQAHAELIIRALRDNNVLNEVVHVADGRAALDYLFHLGQYEDASRSPAPGIILLDLKLPKVDGLEVLKQIKEDPELKKIPVVVLTTSERPEDIDAAYRGYANSYVTKPVTIEGFRKCVREIKFYWAVVNHAR
ncbi:MAG: response regulator [Phycisphaerae bacterium]